MILVPDGDLYPKYIADPRRSNFTFMKMSYSSTGIQASGKNRFGLKLGGRYGFFRFYKGEDPGSLFQFDIEGGFIGQFDLDNSTDNIGWDGIYGLQFAWAVETACRQNRGLP